MVSCFDVHEAELHFWGGEAVTITCGGCSLMCSKIALSFHFILGNQDISHYHYNKMNLGRATNKSLLSLVFPLCRRQLCPIIWTRALGVMHRDLHHITNQQRHQKSGAEKRCTIEKQRLRFILSKLPFTLFFLYHSDANWC